MIRKVKNFTLVLLALLAPLGLGLISQYQFARELFLIASLGIGSFALLLFLSVIVINADNLSERRFVFLKIGVHLWVLLTFVSVLWGIVNMSQIYKIVSSYSELVALSLSLVGFLGTVCSLELWFLEF